MWNTVISLGITLITVYGREIGNFFAELTKGEQALFNFTKMQNEFNESRRSAAVDFKKETEIYKQYRDIAADASLGYDKQKIAIDKLRSVYPYWLKNLTDEQITRLKGSKIEEEILKARSAESQLEGKNKDIENVNQKIALYEQEIKAKLDFANKTKELNKTINDNLKFIASTTTSLSPGGGGGYVEYTAAGKDALKALKALNEEEKLRLSLIEDEEVKNANTIKLMKGIAAAQGTVNLLDQQAAILKKQQIGLEYKIDNKERTKEIRERIRANKDLLASEFDIVKLQLQIAIKYAEKTMNDDEKSIDIRKKAALQLTEFKTQLSEREYQEEVRVNEFKLKEDLRVSAVRMANELIENRENLAAKRSTVDYSNQIIKEANDREVNLTKDTQNKNLIAFVKLADRRKEIYDETFKYLKGVEDKLNDTVEQNGVTQAQLEGIRQLNLLLQNVSTASTAEDYKKIEDLKLAIATNTTTELINIQRRRADNEISVYEKAYQRRVVLENNLRKLLDKPQPLTEDETAQLEAIKKELSENLNSYDKNSQAYADLIAKKTALDLQYEEVKKQQQEKEKARIIELQAATDAYIKTFTDSYLSSAGLGSLSMFFDKQFDAIDGKWKSTFDKLFDGASTMTEKFQVAFLAISTLAEEAFEAINKSSSASFDREFERLEKQHDLAIGFAGDSATAKAEIDRQYEQKRISIERRKAQAEKDNAIYSAIINGAQAVVAALPNIALSVIVGAIAAAQIAAIASQPLPQYALGTDNHPGGPMMVNDGPAGRHQETVVEPGKAPYKPQGRNVIMHGKKGTKVFTHSQWEHEKRLNELLDTAGIAPAAESVLESMLRGLNIDMSNNNGGGGGPGFTPEELEGAMERSLSKLPVTNWNVDEDGFSRWTVKQNQKNIEHNLRVSGKGINV